MASNASNGFLLIGGAVVAQAADIQWGSKNNGKLEFVLNGSAGTVVGSREVAVTVKCTTPKRARERLRIIRAYEAGDEVTFRYRTADGECTAKGIITETNLASRANEGDSFDFSFVGQEDRHRTVTES
jgi:hypothetical protein